MKPLFLAYRWLPVHCICFFVGKCRGKHKFCASPLPPPPLPPSPIPLLFFLLPLPSLSSSPSSCSMFNFLRKCPSVIQSGHNILHPHQQCMQTQTFPHSHQHLVWWCKAWYGGHSTRSASVSYGDFNTNFLITNDVEHLLCLFSICISFDPIILLFLF